MIEFHRSEATTPPFKTCQLCAACEQPIARGHRRLVSHGRWRHRSCAHPAEWSTSYTCGLHDCPGCDTGEFLCSAAVKCRTCTAFLACPDPFDQLAEILASTRKIHEDDLCELVMAHDLAWCEEDCSGMTCCEGERVLTRLTYALTAQGQLIGVSVAD
jgi:hypothetical protein